MVSRNHKSKFNETIVLSTMNLLWYYFRLRPIFWWKEKNTNSLTNCGNKMIVSRNILQFLCLRFFILKAYGSGIQFVLIKTSLLNQSMSVCLQVCYHSWAWSLLLYSAKQSFCSIFRSSHSNVLKTAWLGFRSEISSSRENEAGGHCPMWARRKVTIAWKPVPTYHNALLKKLLVFQCLKLFLKCLACGERQWDHVYFYSLFLTIWPPWWVGHMWITMEMSWRNTPCLYIEKAGLPYHSWRELKVVRTTVDEHSPLCILHFPSFPFPLHSLVFLLPFFFSLFPSPLISLLLPILTFLLPCSPSLLLFLCTLFHSHLFLLFSLFSTPSLQLSLFCGLNLGPTTG